jgi:tRNA nucleotidyltransferase (CCA-adding enzyme)
MPNLAQLLTSKSSDEYRRVFDLCKVIGEELDGVEGVFVVGGIVRDLIIGREPGDIDLTVVGDANAFAAELAVRTGAPVPTESQFLTFKIDTNDSVPGISSIDIVTARSETYAEPAALPDVSPSTVEDDLSRRDFTVNSMAISLSAQNWGNLVDPSNGFGDIMRKRIKVLHDSSFVDDPTRMFRAVRYATRLDFSIDSRSEKLISESLQNIDQLSGTRIRNEFETILAEDTRVESLQMCEKLGILAAISPGLRVGTRALQVLEELAKNRTLSSDIQELLALTTFGLNEDEAKQTVKRLSETSDWGESILGNAELAKTVTVLDQTDLRPSEVVEILSGIPLASIRAYIEAGPPLPRRGRLIDYVETLRFVEPEISGDDLLDIGIPQGPTIGELLEVVRRSRLDGQVNSRQEELELVKSRLPGFLTK